MPECLITKAQTETTVHNPVVRYSFHNLGSDGVTEWKVADGKVLKYIQVSSQSSTAFSERQDFLTEPPLPSSFHIQSA